MAPTPANTSFGRFLTTLRDRLPENLSQDTVVMFAKRLQAEPELATRVLPVKASNVLTAREEAHTIVNPGQGAVNPNKINMQALLALFAIIGAAFVIAGIWFFFWAKNGGFVWRKNDWEDYKSSVLRRKSPNGSTLSNATKSTKLGGGSIVGRGYSDYDGQTTTMETETVVTEKKSRGQRLKESAKQKLLRKRKDETWEGAHDEDVRAYRHEKPARVGGINCEPDGTYHGTEYTGTLEQRSEMTHSHTETETQYDPPERQRGDRTVSSFSFTQGEDTISNVTEEPLLRDQGHRREAQSRSRNSQRPRGPRQGANSHSRPASPRKRDRSAVPGGYTTPLDMSSISASDYVYDQLGAAPSGTKSYHHPIPGLSKGYRRAGGGRGRRDSLSDSEGEDYDSRLS